jgi:hypothetical protein
MAVSVGNFVKKSDGTGQQTFAHGLGTTPKALILASTRNTAAGSYTSNLFQCFGFTDGTSSFCVSQYSDGAAGTSNSTSGRSNTLFYQVTTDDNVDANASFVSWDATNVTINWTANTAVAAIVGFIAIGGSPVQAKVVTYNTGTATGALSVTGAGFTPTAAIHIHDSKQTTTVPSLSAIAGFGIGAASGSAQWYIYGRSSDAQAFSFDKGFSDNDSILFKCDSVAVVDGQISHTAFTTDGETVNRDVATVASMTVGVLFLRGLNLDATSFSKTTNTSVPVAQNVAVAFTPVAALTVTDSKVSGALAPDLRIGVGFSDGTNEYTTASIGIDSQDPTETFSFTSTTKGIVLCDNATPATSAEADITFGSNIATYTWTTNDADEHRLRVLAFGAELPTGGAKGKGKGGNNPGPGEPPKKPLRTSLSKSWKWDRGWR